MPRGLPAPPNLRTDISIAEKHMRLVIGSGVVALVASIVLGGFVGGAGWLAIIVASFLVPFLVFVLLTRRYESLYAESSLYMRPTNRKADRRLTRTWGWFGANGFEAAPPQVTVTSSGQVLDRPTFVHHRKSDGAIAIVHLAGFAFVSRLSDDRWLITSTAPVIPHESLVIQRTKDAAVQPVYLLHEKGKAVLAGRGIGWVPANMSPTDVALELELLEQDRFRRKLASGGSLWQLIREANSRDIGTLLDGRAAEFTG